MAPNQHTQPPADTGTSTASPPPRKLSADLSQLAQLSTERPLTLREVQETLGERSGLLICYFLALPFTIPLPSAGLSTVLGLVIAAIAIQILLGKQPKLTGKLLNREMPHGFFSKLLSASLRVILWSEKFLRPRLAAIVHGRLQHRLHGATILLAAFVLLLPLPIPLSNTFPAWAILLIAGGLLENDGKAIIAGYIASLLGAAYFLILAFASTELIQQIKTWLAI